MSDVDKRKDKDKRGNTELIYENQEGKLVLNISTASSEILQCGQCGLSFAFRVKSGEPHWEQK